MGMFPGQSSESAGRSEERYSRSRCCKSEIAMVPGAKTDTHRIDITVYLAAGRVGRGLRFVGPIRQRGLKLKRGDNIVLGPLTFKQFKCTLYGGPSGGI